MTTSFFVPGVPRPQGSKRSVGNNRSIEASAHLPAWRQAVTMVARNAHKQSAVEGPVTVWATFVFPRAKTLKDRPAPPHVSAPDTDKLQRAVGDALEKAGVVKDDAQIVSWRADKRRAEPGESPGVHVVVEWG